VEWRSVPGSQERQTGNMAQCNQARKSARSGRQLPGQSQVHWRSANTVEDAWLMDGQVCLLYFKLQPSEMMNFPCSQVHPLSIHTHTQREMVPAKVYCMCTKQHGSISKQTVILVFNHCENARFCVCLSVCPSVSYIYTLTAQGLLQWEPFTLAH